MGLPKRGRKTTTQLWKMAGHSEMGNFLWILFSLVQLYCFFSLLAKGQKAKFSNSKCLTFGKQFYCFLLSKTLRKYKLKPQQSQQRIFLLPQMLRTMENRKRRRGEVDPIYPDRFWINQCFVGFRKSFL